MTDPTPRFEPRPDSRPQDAPWPVMTWPPPEGVVLRGPTVELRPMDPGADAAQLFAALDHDAVWTHVAGRPADAGSLASALATGISGGRYAWAVRLTAAAGDFGVGAVVGMTSYLDVSVPDARLEIGWTAYSPSVWATGVNAGAKLLLLGYAFETLNCGRVQIKTDVRNHRSQQAIARLGATYEGTLRRYQRRDDGTVRDTVLFSVLAEEWAEARAGLEARVAP